MKNKVLIIYTGGTIGTDKSNDGEPPAPKSVRKVLEKMPMLRNPKTPEWELFEVEVPKASEDISVFDYNLIGEIIEQNYQKFGGFVILHGTDTLAYTASALSFSLENLNKPVILTGAQIPLFMPRNDGITNLMTALTIKIMTIKSLNCAKNFDTTLWRLASSSLFFEPFFDLSCTVFSYTMMYRIYNLLLFL